MEIEDKLKAIEEIFENLFKNSDIIGGIKEIRKELEFWEEQGYDVSKYKEKYVEEALKHPELKWQV